MDKTDYEILACLKENARENATTIGAKINLSTSAVIERIKKFEASGLIKQYTVILNQQALGGELMAFISVRLEHPKYYENFVELINSHNSIAECYYIAGDFDFILKILIDSSEGLESLYRMVRGFEGVKATKTYIILKNIKNDITLIPESLAN